MQNTEYEWRILNDELARLRFENEFLRERIAKLETSQNESRQINRRKTIPGEWIKYETNDSRYMYKMEIMDKSQLVAYLENWSMRISRNFFIPEKIDYDEEEAMNEINEKDDYNAFQKNKRDELDELGLVMIESIAFMERSQPVQRKENIFIYEVCLFGPSEEDLMDHKERKFTAKHQLYVPYTDKKFYLYGFYLYPDAVPVKQLRSGNMHVEIDKIIFKKSFRQQDSHIFIFLGRDNPSFKHVVEKEKEELLRQVNQDRLLYALAIEFTDFICCEKFMESELVPSYIEYSYSGYKKFPGGSVELELEKGQCVYRSSFHLCILTYSPFVNFLTEIIVKLIDEVKIKRMQEYSARPKEFINLDIRYFAKELKPLINYVLNKVYLCTPKLGYVLTIPFESNVLTLNLSQYNLWHYLYKNWAFRILKMFDRDSLLYIYTLLMLYYSILIVCENVHVLTFTIMLLTSMMVRPFFYPHPCVSVLFNEELLDNPFTGILGLNKSTKWLDANIEYLSTQKDNKVVVNLNEEYIKIKSRKKIKIVKSYRLKKIIINFYKKIEKLDGGTTLFKRKEVVLRYTLPQYNYIAQSLSTDLITFYYEYILACLPNRYIIQNIKEGMPTYNSSMRASLLIKHIYRFISYNRKLREKDTFLEAFMQKQIFYVYLALKYDI